MARAQRVAAFRACIVRDLTDQEVLELGIENVQRPISTLSRGRVSRLIERSGYTQDQLAEVIGRAVATWQIRPAIETAGRCRRSFKKETDSRPRTSTRYREDAEALRSGSSNAT